MPGNFSKGSRRLAIMPNSSKERKTMHTVTGWLSANLAMPAANGVLLSIGFISCHRCTGISKVLAIKYRIEHRQQNEGDC